MESMARRKGDLNKEKCASPGTVLLGEEDEEPWPQVAVSSGMPAPPPARLCLGGVRAGEGGVQRAWWVRDLARSEHSSRKPR